MLTEEYRFINNLQIQVSYESFHYHLVLQPRGDIAQAIESVLSQDYPDIEYIV